MKKTLSEIAIYTAVPADLIAIITAMWQLLSIRFTNGNSNLANIKIPIVSVTMGGRDLYLVLVIYAILAFLYWIVSNLREKSISSQKKFSFLRTLSIAIPLLFGVPFLFVLMAFSSIRVGTGFALSSICLLVSASIYSRWNNKNGYFYEDLGLWYLWWIPIVWLFLQQSNPDQLLSNLGLSYVYSALGYLFSVLSAGVVITLFVLPISHIGFSQHTLDLLLKFYILSRARLMALVVTVCCLILVGVVMLLIWVVKLLIIILFFILVAVGIGIALYYSSN